MSVPSHILNIQDDDIISTSPSLRSENGVSETDSVISENDELTVESGLVSTASLSFLRRELEAPDSPSLGDNNEQSGSQTGSITGKRKKKKKERQVNKKVIWLQSVYVFFQSFAYYGATAILVLYFDEELEFSSETSTALVHYFLSTTFFFTVIGGLIADYYNALFKTIMWSIFIWAVGTGIIVLSAVPGWDLEKNTWIPLIGLALLAIGKGALTPANSAIFGLELQGCPMNVISSGFTWFIFSISFGSLFSKFIIPAIRSNAPYHYFTAFSLCLITLFFGSIAFVVKKNEFRKQKKPKKKRNAILEIYQVIKAAFSTTHEEYVASLTLTPNANNDSQADDDTVPLLNSVSSYQQQNQNSLNGSYNAYQYSFLDKARVKCDDVVVNDVKATVRVFKMFLPLPIFWCLFYQTYTTWTLQADDMNRYIFGVEISADMIQGLNPLFDIALIPLFNGIIYPFLRNRYGLQLLPLNRLVVGMILGALSFLTTGFIQKQIDDNPVDDDGHQGISVAWQIPQYFILSVGEVLVNPAGLEFANSQAPISMKTAIQALWYFMVGIGNIMIVAIESFTFCGKSCTYFFYSGLMFVFSFFFAFMAVPYKYRDIFITSTSSYLA